MAFQQRTVLLFLAAAVVMLTCPSGVRSRCCCPTFWTAYGEHCYRFFGYNMTWQEAENHCQSYTVPSLGDGEAVIDSLGHLVSIHSEAEQNFASTFFESARKTEPGPRLWIGLHDTTTESNFEWTDGTPFDFIFWAPGQPDDWRSREDCVHLRSTFLWNDVPCTYHGVYYFICKLPAW